MSEQDVTDADATVPEQIPDMVPEATDGAEPTEAMTLEAELEQIDGALVVLDDLVDVQQGNALDQENVARLKPGLNRSQVRFLLGTPLVVDPFSTDRWDYVYVYYKAGKLAEQKRITLFFEGGTLVRIEGDMPAAEAPGQPSAPAVQTESKAETTALPPSAKVQPELVAPPAAPAVAQAVSVVVEPKPQAVAPAALAAPMVAAATVAPAAPSQAAPPKTVSRPAAQGTSVVAPLPSPKNAPA